MSGWGELRLLLQPSKDSACEAWVLDPLVVQIRITCHTVEVVMIGLRHGSGGDSDSWNGGLRVAESAHVLAAVSGHVQDRLREALGGDQVT